MFDVVVVGAGHAGCEAALAAARLGARVVMVTLRREQVGRLSCNPAMGGLAKGCLVREIDALGGAIARVTDAATIQFRRLNTRKGLAVQASRAQVDIDLYPRRMAERVTAQPGLTLVEGEVAGVRVRDGRVAGVVLADGSEIEARAVVLTTGTFLGGVLHRGAERTEGGRVGEGAAHRLGAQLRALGVRMGRMKTGTTPRLDGRTITWDRLERQEDLADGRFSFAPAPPRVGSRACSITYTNAETHARIRESLHLSPVYAGAITGRGPRYCPSIEDKVVRFPDKERHLLFLEPEGLATDRVYVNGTSTSLPVEVQDAMIRSIEGLEHARIVQYGYAVEYDYADPLQLGHDLQHRDIPGLFLAGQINGTSGYEEAAAQGLVAGVGAAARELSLGRDDANIGVLVDDLVTRGVDGEPYRMFPSRAEHRLSLREDNADRRLTPKGRAIGLVDDESWARFEVKEAEIARIRAAVDAPRLRRPEVSIADLGFEGEAAEQVEIDVKYEGYVVRDRARQAATRRMEAVSLDGLDFAALGQLSFEVRERLARHRPATLGAAARLPGVTPAAVDVLAAALARRA